MSSKIKLDSKSHDKFVGISEDTKNRLIRKSIGAFGTEILNMNENYADIWRGIFRDVSKGKIKEQTQTSVQGLAKDSKYNKEITMLKRLYQENKNNPHAIKREVSTHMTQFKPLFQTTIGSTKYNNFLKSRTNQFSGLTEDFIKVMKYYVTGVFQKEDGSNVVMQPKDRHLLYDKMSANKIALFVYSIIEFKKYLYQHASD